MSKNFFQKYFKDQSNLLNFDEETLIKLNKVKNFLTVVKKRKKKVIQQCRYAPEEAKKSRPVKPKS